MRRCTKKDYEFLKKLITKNAITLADLDRDQLCFMIDCEAETIMAKKHKASNNLLALCVEELNRRENLDGDLSAEKCHRILYNKMITENNLKNAHKSHGLRKFGFGRVAVICAIVLILLSTTVCAVSNPFSDFFNSIKDILNISSGDIVISGDKSLTVDSDAVSFDSLNEFENLLRIKLNRKLVLPDEHIVFIIYEHQGRQEYVLIKAVIEGNEYFETIYLKAAPYSETALASSDAVSEKEINGHTYFIIADGENSEAITFDEFTYCISTSDEENLIEYLEAKK